MDGDIGGDDDQARDGEEAFCSEKESREVDGDDEKEEIEHYVIDEIDA